MHTPLLQISSFDILTTTRYQHLIYILATKYQHLIDAFGMKYQHIVETIHQIKTFYKNNNK